MEVSALLTQFRLDVRDTVQTYLWSDVEFWSYLNEAQNEFCRLIGGIADATSSVAARIPVAIGVNHAPLSPLVMKVRAAFDADGVKLDILNFEDLEASSSNGSELFAPVSGPLRGMVVGMEPNKVFFTTLPDAAQTVNLIVYRYPIEEIEDENSSLEIDPQHHLALLLWVRHRAHLKPDAETYDRGRAEQYERDFKLYCERAKSEKGLHDHKHRLVQFSW